MQSNTDNTNNKRRICCIFVGAAAWSNGSGQISDLRDADNCQITFISIDPNHKYNQNNGKNINKFDENLESRSGLPINRMENSNHIIKGCLNVSTLLSYDFFMEFELMPNIYYVILTFMGHSINSPSVCIAESIGIKNPFFYDLDNALCLGMSCLNKAPNIIDLLIHYGLNPFEDVFPNLKERYFVLLQNAHYACIHNITGLCQHIRSSTTRDWHSRSIEQLASLNLYSVDDIIKFHDYIESMIGIENMSGNNISKMITKELEDQGILKFFDERPNDFN